MLEAIEKLLIIQEKDQRLQSLKKELANLPLERGHLDAQLETAAARLEKAKSRSREIDVERNKLQVEARGKRDQIAKYRTQQMQTRKNEEFSALSHEIEAAERTISALEDRELELMEETELLTPEIKAAEDTFAQDKSAVATKHAQIDKREAAIKQRIAELDAERTSACQTVDPDTLSTYQRLMKSKGDAAVVPMDGEICTGCHMKVTTSTFHQVKASRQIVHCPNCARMLYFSS